MDDFETKISALEGAIPPAEPPLPPPIAGVVLLPAGRTSPAGFVRRTLAFVIDFSLLGFLWCILALFGFSGLYLSKGELPSTAALIAPFVSIWFVLFIGYFTFFHSHSGQTPAKRLIRIKVVDKEGNLLFHWAALFRSLLSLFSLLFFSVGFLFAMFGKKKQGLHDMLVRSYVVLD
ncbi:MAG: RDD family protein [Nitrospirae bacterium]|nr:RDD family protein [Candidatus Troglogloeales bacterium]MBI3598245.1 RDD family protein [Candidatus Troglogloeales bacterium]